MDFKFNTEEGLKFLVEQREKIIQDFESAFIVEIRGMIIADIFVTRFNSLEKCSVTYRVKLQLKDKSIHDILEVPANEKPEESAKKLQTKIEQMLIKNCQFKIGEVFNKMTRTEFA